MAFGVVAWKNNLMVVKNDPEYIRWEVKLNMYLPDTK